MNKKFNSQLLRIKQINIMNSEKMILKVKFQETHLVYKLMIEKTIMLKW